MGKMWSEDLQIFTVHGLKCICWCRQNQT